MKKQNEKMACPEAMDAETALENTAPYNLKRLVGWIVLVVGVILLIRLGIRLLADRKYNLVSVMIALLACVPFYFTYEKREGSIRRMVMIAVMTAIAVLGRLIFGPIPAFKPMAAIIILTGIYMGPESGFLVGSLEAVVSNIFFGQGPWTPFQMLTLGLTGLLSGLPGLRALLRRRLPLAIWGLLMGIMYSGIMDIWTVLSLIDGFNWHRYLLALSTALPYTITYMVSNVVFLMLTIKPIGEKLNRIQIKHGIF
ncbi:ECF transporter S component [Fusibacillus kribbianus]|uniref:ECF transporter S component n=1 Tax=Fusibacillus kribbianus TaxID=3044208 RepID=A0AAP4B8L4_9FIRM|nr:ECF transporter S component [Ruminococcus sp. YH-rum2234]MDI9241277.1 ECF transporter S component [Ruminococcus sp. YH-rum2234]